MKLMKRFIYLPIEWLDERFNIKGAIEKNLTKKMVPKGMKWFGCFGGMAVIAFLMQIGSGIFLALYYIPSASEAFNSIQYVRHSVPYGWFIQKMHAVGPNVIIALLLCHIVRILVKGAYRKPRELHWASGVVLFVLTLLICYTGASLPASQLDYWGIKRAEGISIDVSKHNSPTKVGGAVPYLHRLKPMAARTDSMEGTSVAPTIVTSYDVGILRDGTRFNEHKLTFIYIIHIVCIPIVILTIMALHFVMVRRTGIDEPL